jgi:hypothetical protein
MSMETSAPPSLMTKSATDWPGLEVTRVVVAFRKRIAEKDVDSRWQERGYTDLLAERDPHVFDSELGQRFAAQRRATADQRSRSRLGVGPPQAFDRLDRGHRVTVADQLVWVAT